MDLVTVRPVKNRGREQGRRFKCVAANQIEEQEPDGDHDGADDAGDRSVDNDPRPRVLHVSTTNPQDQRRQASNLARNIPHQETGFRRVKFEVAERFAVGRCIGTNQNVTSTKAPKVR